MESYIQKLRNSLVHFSCFDMLELKYYRVSQQAKRGCELSFDLSDLWGCQRPKLKNCKLEIFLSPNLFGHPVVKRKFNGQLVAIILNRMGITEWQLRHEVKGRWKSQLTLTVISRLMHLHLSSIQVYFRLILNSKIIGVTCGFFKGLLISNDHDTFPLSLNQVY